MNDKVKNLLGDFNLTLQLSVKEVDTLLNILAQCPFIQVAGFIHTIQTQVAPQVEQAKKSLEAVAEANKNEP